MPILFAVVARGTTILAKYASCAGNFSEVTEQILNKIGAENSKLTYSHGSYLFHYISDDRIVFLCITDDDFERSKAFHFLNEIKRRFEMQYGVRAKTALPYAMNSEFSRVLASQMRHVTESREPDQMNKVQGQVDELKGIMVKNIDMVADRGEKLELLVDKTEELNANDAVSHPAILKADSVLDFHASQFDRDDSFGYNVEDYERTITSLGGVSVDSMDNTVLDEAPFPCGSLQFENVDDTSGSDIEMRKQYVTVGNDCSAADVCSFMGTYWRMHNPKIVVSIISGVKHFKPWKNKHLRKQFQKGIIKAANTTEMWIITNGVDYGISKMIGEAIQEERAKRSSNRAQTSQVKVEEEKKFTPLTLIGIVPKTGLKYGSYFEDSDVKVIKNDGVYSEEQELNPDHTHFVVVEDLDERERSLFTNTRCSIEQQLQYQVSRTRKLRKLFGLGRQCSEDQQETKRRVPVIGLFVQGSPHSIDNILFYLSNKMPVLVLKGSGGTADLLAYAFEEMQERIDEEFREHIMKPELIKMISKLYPYDFKDNDMARCEFRDKILECVDLAQDEEQVFLNIVNMQGWDANLKELDKYLLKALFNCEKLKNKEQLYKDLQLLLDWNRPDLAESEIFQRDDGGKIKVSKHLFEQALLKKDREDFVEIFLDQGMQVHKYLNHKKLKLLFERAEDREFFVSICMDKVLGKDVGENQLLDHSFLVLDLNRLVYKLAGIQDFVHPYELSMNSVGMYVVDQAVAEQKALYCLIVWAVLMNRFKLAKALWNRIDEPIAVALICSNMYRVLSKVQMELFLREELEENAQQFGRMALSVLEIGHRESSTQAYTMLSNKLPDFNNKSVMQIAHDANYLGFIAHPCCQKWITNKMFGSIRVKELDWGFIRLPDWLKILLSCFLIFPMFIWISFEPVASWRKDKKVRLDLDVKKSDDESEVDSESSDNDEATSILDTELKKMKKRDEIKVRLKSVLKDKRKGHKLPFYQQLYLLWSSPLTKFWVTQFHRHMYQGPSLLGALLEIVIMGVFLFFYLFLRVIPHWHKYGDVIFSKTVLCLGLIFFFYRLLGTYLPISSTLGPMLVRMKRMIKGDFVVFVRMFLIFLFSGGVTIQAILYPNFPLTKELIRRVLTRPLFAMFLTEIGDLSGEECTTNYANITPEYCAADPVVEPLQRCPYSSFFGYVITIQYLLICKLVLVTLLYAMFSLTIAKVSSEANEIWRFQRYALVMEFESRLIFPPPFTILYYVYMLIRLIINKLKGCRSACCGKCCCRKKSKLDERGHSVRRQKRSRNYNYWKQCSQDFNTTERAKQKEENHTKQQTTMINSVHEDMRLQKKNMKRINERILELERTMHASRMYLESIFHKMDKTDVLGVSTTKGQIVHVAARQSPYPSTRIVRFPVFDKYVPWQQKYDIYDPKVYTKTRTDFTEEEIIYVDEDLIELMKLRQERELLSEEDLSELPPLPVFTPKWNMVLAKRLGVDKTMIIDRRSWISMDNQPHRYKVDASGLPINPMGRTGMRGKGVLWRWGPNHVIKAVCTRWRQTYRPDGQMADYLYVEGKKLLEFIAIQNDRDSEWVYELPGAALQGLKTPYLSLCEAFVNSVFNEEDYKGSHLDQGDMIQFFAQFATPGSKAADPSAPQPLTFIQAKIGSKSNLKVDMDSHGFSASLLYKGYLDDPRNTDNAWVETEVWNFHYDLGDTFNSRIPEEFSVTWKEVSPSVRLFGNEGAIVQEAARIHDAYH
ncbi:hypothetical protein FSP39_023943 [Pinctada imbricata]|uniref:Uncharacterized protein n=1 Tax=Pinctada imbricata TaxID=66713 RepID=A0AA89C039_PINIB|nr:hypothetical protein FSP39_023943 [Pinctada imbricata]